MRNQSIAWGDFRRLWTAYGVSQAGSAVGAGAIPLIAVTILHVADWQVTLMATLGGLVATVLALPLGPFIEFRYKRPTMIAADLIRFAILSAVPVAAFFGHLSFPLLCAAQAAATAGAIAFAAAHSAYLKDLLEPEALTKANSRIESTYWTVTAGGPTLGGVLIAAFGGTITIAIDAVSFLLSAVGLYRLRVPESKPAMRETDRKWLGELRAGWTAILNESVLRALYVNAMLFGCGLLLITAIMPVFILRDLGLAPWQYGLSLGFPALGGVVGAMSSAAITQRTDARLVLLVFGASRTVWAGLLCVARPGVAGLLVILTCDTLLMFSAGVFNPVFTTLRMRVTPNHLMARVSVTWSISAKLAQSAGMLIGGVVASTLGVRWSIGVGAGIMLAASLALPWRRRKPLQPNNSLSVDRPRPANV